MISSRRCVGEEKVAGRIGRTGRGEEQCRKEQGQDPWVHDKDGWWIDWRA